MLRKLGCNFLRQRHRETARKRAAYTTLSYTAITQQPVHRQQASPTLDQDIGYARVYPFLTTFAYLRKSTYLLMMRSYMVSHFGEPIKNITLNTRCVTSRNGLSIGVCTGLERHIYWDVHKTKSTENWLPLSQEQYTASTSCTGRMTGSVPNPSNRRLWSNPRPRFFFPLRQNSVSGENAEG